jgi:hypothetical protein
MFEIKVVEKIKTHILHSAIPPTPTKVVPMKKDMRKPDGPQMAI